MHYFTADSIMCNGAVGIFTFGLETGGTRFMPEHPQGHRSLFAYLIKYAIHDSSFIELHVAVMCNLGRHEYVAVELTQLCALCITCQTV